MKPLILVFALALSFPPVRAQSATNAATIKSYLTWDLNPLSEAVDYYNVYLIGPTNAVVQAQVPPVSITNLVANARNGVFTVTVTAVNVSGIESDPSVPVFFFWYGQKPSAPTNRVVTFTRVPLSPPKP